ncbi:hypothetical protein R6V09_43535 [Streptomyces sp. W16]|uniref:hypothetical protein n=1 Tax=Streptomyces sp. W16 TaxID=3076631 RepID=UPI00295C33E7|nr:hypothetical protein [Streptomyces sp. W16]MDV9176987.1 hypothetical protein [Streptomyces sp. W16]
MPGADVAAELCVQHGDGAVLPLVRTEDVEAPADTAELLGAVRSHEDAGVAGAAAPAEFRHRAAADGPSTAMDVGRDPVALMADTATATSPTPRSPTQLLTASPDVPRTDRADCPTTV